VLSDPHDPAFGGVAKNDEYRFQSIAGSLVPKLELGNERHERYERHERRVNSSPRQQQQFNSCHIELKDYPIYLFFAASQAIQAPDN